MYYAINRYNEKIYIEDVKNNEEYFCPVCGAKLKRKKTENGNVYFSHDDEQCTDHWNYDLSSWSRKMQECFGKDQREIIISSNGKKHRANVLIGDTVIEFQHGHISADEFLERTEFYNAAGYRLVWIFDLTKYFKENKLNSEGESLYRWDNPIRALQCSCIPQQKNQKNSICFYFPDISEDRKNIVVYRVMTSTINNNEDPDYKIFSIDNKCKIILNSKMNVNEFFWDPDTWILMEAVKYGNFRAKIYGKYHGLPYEAHICPLNMENINTDRCKKCPFCPVYVCNNVDDKYLSRFDEICCTYSKHSNSNADRKRKNKPVYFIRRSPDTVFKVGFFRDDEIKNNYK